VLGQIEKPRTHVVIQWNWHAWFPLPLYKRHPWFQCEMIFCGEVRKAYCGVNIRHERRHMLSATCVTQHVPLHTAACSARTILFCSLFNDAAITQNTQHVPETGAVTGGSVLLSETIRIVYRNMGPEMLRHRTRAIRSCSRQQQDSRTSAT
jgi:hypothetical protein